MTAEDRHFNSQPGSMYAATPAMAWQLPADLPLAQLPAVEPLTTATRAVHPIFPRLPPHNGPGFGENQTMMVPGPAVSVTPNLDSFGPTSDPPFADPNRSVRPRNHGVIKIKNVSLSALQGVRYEVRLLPALPWHGVDSCLCCL